MTGAIIEIPENVKLPEATAIKELKPSNVVLVSTESISLNNEQIYDLEFVREQESWSFPELKKYIQELIVEGEKKQEKIGSKINKAVQDANAGVQRPEVDEFRKLTVQADKDIDFLTVKKVMNTALEAGIIEVNFAVLKKEKPPEE